MKRERERERERENPKIPTCQSKLLVLFYSSSKRRIAVA